MDTRQVIAFLLSSALLGTAAAQGVDPSGCEMEISQTPNAAAAVEIIVRNVGEGAALFVRPHWRTDVVIVLTSEAGSGPPRTELGKLMLKDFVEGSIFKRTLKSGESFSETVDLSKLFVLQPATRYSVVATRGVWVNGKQIQLRAEGSITTPEKL